MKNELPLALVEEQAKAEIAAKKRGKNDDAKGFDQPNGVDGFRVTGWCGRAPSGRIERGRRFFAAGFWGGAGHEYVLSEL